MNIGEYIKSVRKQKGISQLDLAIKLGFTRQYISKIESNISSPSIETIEQFASALGMKINPNLFIEND